MAKTVDLDFITSPDHLAEEIALKWDRWNTARESKKAAWKELGNYLYATDTSTTSNKVLEWKNSTTTPKLTQIRDNLHSNYMASLFPSSDWLQWEPQSKDSISRDKKKLITAFMKKKLRDAKFESVISDLVYDWIDYGNCFGGVLHEREQAVSANGELVVKYNGPRLYRISPLDICFDPTASSFEESPKITRTLRSLGELILEGQRESESLWKQDIVDKIKNQRVNVRNGIASKRYTQGQLDKQARFQYDGFGSVFDYYNSDLVEILEFEGNIYDIEKDEIHEKVKITVVDRAWIVDIAPFSSWEGVSYKKHSGWRPRTDNLWAMGPLDNLVGMQYRLDHIENLKADIMDLIVHPIVKIRGEVAFSGWGPGAEVIMAQDSDFTVESPNPAALQANFELDRLERQMEELAGAPKDAMGIRTPGEKTKFEVSQLQNAASRLFQSKLRQFEIEFLEPVVNAMFELAVRKFSAAEEVLVENTELNIQQFQVLNKEDISGHGRLRPIGARHFARQAQLAQDVAQLLSVAQANSKIGVHISGLKAAEMYEELLQLEKWNLVIPNIGVAEELDTQRAMLEAREALEVEQTQPVGLTEGDIDAEIFDSSQSGIEEDEVDGGGFEETLQ